MFLTAKHKQKKNWFKMNRINKKYKWTFSILFNHDNNNVPLIIVEK